ncbi:GNAT family N-acetyltransferase [Mucilaginibacter lacusdianchii]|uniref:GNAT family N-acetyltransferase n=1 Tax=Mucilaginibacter lacusdianchii TaxID=2684211 RepID=UPI00131BE3D0|nr:GNAT family N-acetyltransferase [Mucilaginibacter sp. JXJ CY 39]
MITLSLPVYTPANSLKNWVPSLTYDIILNDTSIIEEINLRSGDTDFLKMYGGQVGYRIDQAFWNMGYATKACILLKPSAIQNGFSCLWITYNPENIGSRRVCEKIGATFIEIVDLPVDSDMYKRGESAVTSGY